MCNVVPNFVSFTGTRADLDELTWIWESLRSVEELELARPVITTYADLVTDRYFSESAPAHARLEHHWGLDAAVADRLQSELLLRGLPILVEPVHMVGLCGAPGHTPGTQRPKVSLRSPFPAVATSAPAHTVNGTRVAVVDSGDLHGRSHMVDFLNGLAATRKADDVVGHGTAVAAVIRQINSNADVTALRVVNSNKGTSYELLCAMTYALWSGLFDAVNVSLSTQTTGGCMTVLGGSLTMVLDICKQNGVQIPPIIAAAGNTNTGQSFGYPARLPGATAVLAWDFNGTPTQYNVAVPKRHATVYATGGDAASTFGTITSSSGTVEPIYGTSFAAAVTTALIIP